MYLWLHGVFVAEHVLSLVVASKGHSLISVRGLLIIIASLLGSTDSRALELQQLQHVGPEVASHQL